MSSAPQQFEWLGTIYKTILDLEASDGAMSIVDCTVPDGSGPPRHVHDVEDEIFVILEGQCEFWLEGTRFECGLGETAFVPRGKEHTFRAIGGTPCRQLVILTPGGFEGFFVDMARGQYRIPEDMEAIIESATRHNLRFTGPPLS